MTEQRIVIDEKYRESLRGLLPITSELYEENYTPKAFAELGIPEELRPVFTIQAMTAKERDEARKGVVSGSDMINK